MTVQLDYVGTKNFPTQHGAGTDDGRYLIKNEQEGGLFPLPTFLLIIKSSFGGKAPSLPSACKPHKHPILINHFLHIASPLSEFFLHWDIKNQSSSESPETTPSGFTSP